MIIVALTANAGTEQRFGPFTNTDIAEETASRLAATCAYRRVEIVHSDDINSEAAVSRTP